VTSPEDLDCTDDISEHEQFALERHLAGSGLSADEFLQEDPTANYASKDAAEVGPQLIVADLPSSCDFTASAEDINALSSAPEGLADDVAIRQGLKTHMAQASAVPIELGYSAPVLQRELARVPFVDQRARPAGTTTPVLVGIEPAAERITLTQLMQVIGVGLGIPVVARFLPPDFQTSGDSFGIRRSLTRCNGVLAFRF
jgi:hypothetical protein